MSRRPARFTEADLCRAAKAAKRAGMAVEVMPDGRIRIVPVENAGTEQDLQIEDETPRPLC